MSPRTTIRLLIADDQEVVRCGLKALLADTGIKVVADVATAREALTYALEHDVDVVLTDVRMPDRTQAAVWAVHKGLAGTAAGGKRLRGP